MFIIDIIGSFTDYSILGADFTPQRSCNIISYPTCCSYVTLMPPHSHPPTPPPRDGGLVLPFLETRQVCEYSRSNAMWLLRLDHEGLPPDSFFGPVSLVIQQPGWREAQAAPWRSMCRFQAARADSWHHPQPLYMWVTAFSAHAASPPLPLHHLQTSLISSKPRPWRWWSRHKPSLQYPGNLWAQLNGCVFLCH